MIIREALQFLRPEEQWACDGTYATLRWLDSTPKPTEQEVVNAWNQIKDEVAWKPVRYKRNLLLNESDWTQSADSPVNRQTWAEYRQKLRNITETFSSPEDVIWPLKPGQ